MMMIRFTRIAAFLAIAASSSMVPVVEAHLRKGSGGNGGHQHHHRHRQNGSNHPHNNHPHGASNNSLRGGAAAGQQLQPSSSFSSLMKPRSEVTDGELLQEQMLLNLELDRYSNDYDEDEEQEETQRQQRKLLAEEEDRALQAELDLLDASHDEEMDRQREHREAQKEAEENQELARSDLTKKQQEIENEIQTMIESYAKRLDLIKRLDLEIKSQPSASSYDNSYAERLEQIKQQANSGESMIGEEEIREATKDPFVREELARRADRENDARLYELVEDDKLDRIAAESMLEAQIADQIQENNEIALDNDRRDSEQLLLEEQDLLLQQEENDNHFDDEDEISRMEIERERRLMESAMAIVEESRRD